MAFPVSAPPMASSLVKVGFNQETSRKALPPERDNSELFIRRMKVGWKSRLLLVIEGMLKINRHQVRPYEVDRGSEVHQVR